MVMKDTPLAMKRRITRANGRAYEYRVLALQLYRALKSASEAPLAEHVLPPRTDLLLQVASERLDNRETT